MATYTNTAIGAKISPLFFAVSDPFPKLVPNTIAVANTYQNVACSGVNGGWPYGCEIAKCPEKWFTVSHTEQLITMNLPNAQKMEVTIAGAIQAATASTYDFVLALYNKAIAASATQASIITSYAMVDVSHTSVSTFYFQDLIIIPRNAQLKFAIKCTNTNASTLLLTYFGFKGV